MKKMIIENTKVREELEREGCAIIRGFVEENTTKKMVDQMTKLVSNWNGLSETVFQTDAGQVAAQGSDSYFFDSADKIHFFWEPKSDKSICENPWDTLCKINKVGHGLHLVDPVFREYSFSKEIKQVVKQVGWEHPVLPQSMYILKNPRVGGEVTAHQDSTFLYTTPRPTCLGLWLALHDADLENGCLWYRPGSHKEPVKRHFRQTILPSGERSSSFDQLVADSEMSDLEGKSLDDIPDDQIHQFLTDRGFISAPVKAGDLVLIHGQVEHLSLKNLSNRPRHSYQLHLVEGPDAGVTWSPDNWLQPAKGTLFESLGL